MLVYIFFFKLIVAPLYDMVGNQATKEVYLVMDDKLGN